MPNLPPGLVYLVQKLPWLLSPSLLTYSAIRALERTFGWAFTTRAIGVAIGSSLPLVLVLAAGWGRLRLSLDARRAGGSLPRKAAFSVRDGLIWTVGGWPGYAWDKDVKRGGGELAFRASDSNAWIGPTGLKIVTSDPAHIKDILAMKPLLLEASRDGKIDLPSSVFDRNVAIALDRATQRMQEGQPIDIQDLLSRLLLDSTSESSDSFRHILGRLPGDLPYPYYVPPKGTGGNETPEKLVSALLETRKAKLLRAAEGDRWPLGEFWRDRLQPRSKVVNSSLAPFLSAEQGPQPVSDISEALLSAQKTASIICSVVYCMAEHPKILSRLRSEVLDVIGSDTSRTPTSEDIRNTKFLRAVIDETLRLYPPTSFLARVATKPSLWPSRKPGAKALYIPTASKVFLGISILNRSQELWGPHAQKFNPDRFHLPGNIPDTPFIFTDVRYEEVSHFVIRLLQRFTSIALVPEAIPFAERPRRASAPLSGDSSGPLERIKIENQVFLRSAGGLWVMLRVA